MSVQCATVAVKAIKSVVRKVLTRRFFKSKIFVVVGGGREVGLGIEGYSK